MALIERARGSLGTCCRRFVVAALTSGCIMLAAHGPAGGQQPRRGPGAIPFDPHDLPADSAARFIPDLPRRVIDDAKAGAVGIRKLASKRLTLYTDLLSTPEVDELPGMFDQAFPQWCEYFGIDAAKYPAWRMTGFLMKDKDRFRRTGLLPGDLPPFPNGFARNDELWLYEQTDDYYRRHLLLHEGTHGLMNTILGGCGPPWYMEGIAELLATHRWAEGQLTLGWVPPSRQHAPGWGRVRMIRDAVAEGRAMSLRGVIEYPPQAHRQNEPYAWCWAAALLMDRHPRYQQRFRQLKRIVLTHDFNRRFFAAMGDDWNRLCEEWRLMVADLEYGYDVARTAVDFTPGRPLPDGGTTLTVAADRGWQNTGLRLEAGTSYRLRASGRYQVDDEPQTWWCEPGGVSIRYYHGRPLGMLLAAIRPERPAPGSTPLLESTAVGLGTRLTPRQTGTLYLKINDSAGELDDNVGELRVEVVAGD